MDSTGRACQSTTAQPSGRACRWWSVSNAEPEPLADKTMRLRYAGSCRICGAALEAGVTAVYERSSKTVRCVSCPEPDSESSAPEPVAVDIGAAGASAQREHDRRAARREERVRTAHPRVGGLLLALTDDPQSTRAWSTGSEGERAVARSLEKWGNERVRVLHDRRIPRSTANIDHIAIAPTGVYVIDAKRYKGRPDLRVQGGLFAPRTTTLIVGRRDCTKLVAGMHKQVGLVRAALEPFGPDLKVRGMLCFVDADWPLIGGSFSIDGVDVLWPKKATQVLNGAGVLTDAQIDEIHRHLATTFPIA